jgi:hypothetical protein
MIAQMFVPTTSSYRSAGRAAMISGIVGLMAYGFLLAAVLTREEWVVSNFGYIMFKAHDVAVILQFIFMIPVLYGIQKLSQKQGAGISRASLNVGIGALLFTALFLLLGIVKIFSDGHYLLPVMVLGVWLMIASGRLVNTLPRVLCWFGMIIGLGLVTFGSFFPAYAIFVDVVILRIPPVDMATYPEPPMNFANMFIHKIIWIGSIMGVAPLPVWTMLVGRYLLREDRGVLQDEVTQSNYQTTIL